MLSAPDGVETGRCTLNVNCIMALHAYKNTAYQHVSPLCSSTQLNGSGAHKPTPRNTPYMFSRLASTTPAHPSRGAGNKRTAHCRVRANLLKCRERATGHTPPMLPLKLAAAHSLTIFKLYGTQKSCCNRPWRPHTSR